MLWVFLALQPFLTVCLASTPFSIPVEHSLDNGKFSPAGNIKGKLSAKGTLLGAPVFARRALSAEEQQSLKKLVEGDGYYKLRMPSSLLDAASSKVMASLRARCLQIGNFEETLSLELTNSNKIAGLDYRTAIRDCSKALEVPDNQGSASFKDEINVVFRYPVAAPYTSVNDWGTNSAGDDQVTEPGSKPTQDSQKQKKTWLQQNWMFVMAGAVVVLQVMGNLGDDRTGQGGQGGQGDGAAVGSNAGGRGGGRGGRGRR